MLITGVPVHEWDGGFCAYCGAELKPDDVEEFISEGMGVTPICPHCGVDAICPTKAEADAYRVDSFGSAPMEEALSFSFKVLGMTGFNPHATCGGQGEHDPSHLFEVVMGSLGDPIFN